MYEDEPEMPLRAYLDNPAGETVADLELCGDDAEGDWAHLRHLTACLTACEGVSAEALHSEVGPVDTLLALLEDAHHYLALIGTNDGAARRLAEALVEGARKVRPDWEPRHAA